MLNDKWIGEGMVRLLGRDGSVFVQGAVNQDVETGRILPRISEKCRMKTARPAAIKANGRWAMEVGQGRRDVRGMIVKGII